MECTRDLLDEFAGPLGAVTGLDTESEATDQTMFEWAKLRHNHLEDMIESYDMLSSQPSAGSSRFYAVVVMAVVLFFCVPVSHRFL